MQKCKKCGQEMPDEAVYCMMCGKKLTIQKKATKQRGNGQGTVYKAPNGKYVAEVTLYFYLDSNGKKHRKKKKEPEAHSRRAHEHRQAPRR